MRMVDVIDTKRNGGELSTAQIEFFINGFTNGKIPDYQISALLMAIYLKGMTESETATMTMTMLHSGDELDLSEIPGVKVDKHSTGGVGDKTSIPLAPLVASLGISVPMISGRGLGHTGGTLDKLEAIPGLKVEISEADFKHQLLDVGCAIVGATGNIAPADKKIYALRDVTDTVDSIPLIAGSIMSKKIASGTDALVLDVKTGSGAFMKTEAAAVALAKELVGIGRSVGMNAMAVISDMNQPLGKAIGNTLEIEESIDLLKGNGPADLLDLVLTIGSQMVVMAKKAPDLATARQELQRHIDNGSALEKFRQMIVAQGGDGDVIEHPDRMPHAQYHVPVTAASDGVITKIKADEMGIAAMMLGGGRQKKDDQLDYGVGLTLAKKVGDRVKRGDTILTIHSNREEISDVKQLIDDNISIGEHAEAMKLIHEIIE